jgi:N-methylhydantoinase A
MAPKPRGRRGVFDAGAGAFVDYTIYERGDFRPGACVPGPALVVEDQTTTVATGAFTVSMDVRSHLILERNSIGERRAP